jgi:hypothetical protein
MRSPCAGDVASIDGDAECEAERLTEFPDGSSIAFL